MALCHAEPHTSLSHCLTMELPTQELPNLSPAQHLFRDGIRYSIAMVSQAYQRLRDIMLRLSDDRQPSDADFTNVFLDSWSIVDSSHRLRRLITSMPGLKQNDPKIVLFLQRTAGVENLRNFIQHANGDIRDLVDQQRPFWGSVSWYRVFTPLQGRLCSMRAGSSHQQHESVPWVNPLGRMVQAPIDLVTLNAACFEVCLSDVARASAAVATDISEQLAARFQLISSAGASDIMVTADVQAEDSGEEISSASPANKPERSL